MSWSASCEIPAGTLKRSDTGEPSEGYNIIQAMQVTGNPDCPQEQKDALHNAKQAALVLLLSGAYGDPEKHSFAVNLSGHVNPEHKPREGWSNDFVNIQIFQRS